MTYPSKISYGMIFFLCVLFGYIAYDTLKDSFDIITLVIILLPLLICLYIFNSIKYTITENQLVIHSGFFFKQNVDISTIKSIRKTNNIISAPAASFDRLEITYNNFDSVIVSPKNKEQFINDLLKINPKITNVNKV